MNTITKSSDINANQLAVLKRLTIEEDYISLQRKLLTTAQDELTCLMIGLMDDLQAEEEGSAEAIKMQAQIVNLTHSIDAILRIKNDLYELTL